MVKGLVLSGFGNTKLMNRLLSCNGYIVHMCAHEMFGMLLKKRFALIPIQLLQVIIYNQLLHTRLQ